MTSTLPQSTPAHAWPYPRWIAHRGAGKLAPENTLSAFRLGAQHGYRMFECDVKLSADGVPFLLHDSTLERTTNGHGIAGALPWAELSQLDAGSWHSRLCAGEPLLTLDNLARHCLANGHMVNLEIKPTPGLESHTGQVVAAQAARLWAQAPTPPLLTSFQVEALQAAQATAPALPRGLLLDRHRADWLEVARSLGCVAVVWHHSLWNAESVATAHGAGLKALCYTVNDEWLAQWLWGIGLDGLITDRVDRFSPG